MKKVLIAILLGCTIIGGLAGCTGEHPEGQKPAAKCVTEENQGKAAGKIDELASYVKKNRDLLVHYVQVAQPGTKDWNTLMKLFDNLNGGRKMVGYLDAPYDKQEKQISHLANMATHFKVYMKDRDGRAKEFSKGMKELQAFEKIK